MSPKLVRHDGELFSPLLKVAFLRSAVPEIRQTSIGIAKRTISASSMRRITTSIAPALDLQPLPRNIAALKQRSVTAELGAPKPTVTPEGVSGEGRGLPQYLVYRVSKIHQGKF